MSTISPVAAGTTPAVAGSQNLSTKFADAAKSALKMVGDFFAAIPGFVMKHKVAAGVVLAIIVLAAAANYFLSKNNAADGADETTGPQPRAKNQRRDGPEERSSVAPAATSAASDSKSSAV